MKAALRKFANVVLPWRWWTAYWNYILKITTSGYVGRLSPRWVAFVKTLFRAWRWVQVGKVNVINRHFLDTPGRVIFVGTHSSMLDVIASYPEINRRVRAIGAYEPLRKFLGIPALVLSRVGVAAVDRKRGKTVIQPAINILIAGDALALFPEGQISPTGKLLPLKPGAALFANAVFDHFDGKEPVAIVCVHFCYGKRHAASAFNYLRMGLRWRGGLTLTAMEPIWMHELEDRSVNKITALIRRNFESVACATAGSDR